MMRMSSLKRGPKRLLQALFDSLWLIACFPAAMFLRLERTDMLADPGIWLGIAITVPFTIAMFVFTGIYRPVLRYISAETFARIFTALFLASIVLFAVSRVVPLPIPRSVPAIWLLLGLGGIAASRFAYRSILVRLGRNQRTPVLIWGSGDLARELVYSLSQGTEYRPVGMIGETGSFFREEVMGVRMYQQSSIPALVENLNVKHVFVALESGGAEARQEIVDQFSKFDVDVFTIPSAADIVSGRASISQVRAIKIEDLLGREPVAPDPDLMAKTIQGQVVLVTGAGGSIGSELCRQIAAIGPQKLVLVEVSEYSLYEIDMELRSRLVPYAPFEIVPVLGSVINADFMRQVMSDHGVNTVYHAAAYKHVPLVEDNVVAAIRNNVFGTMATAEAAADTGVSSFTLVSTDKAVRPTNVMGASKRVAELFCQALAQRSGDITVSMVRFGNVLGSSGSVIPRFRQQLHDQKPITVTDPEITRYFMTIPEAAQLVVQAAGIARGGDTFLLDMGDPVKIVDLAARMIQLYGDAPYVSDEALASKLGLPNEGTREIVFTGLRPGEKLYEELLIDETSSATRHPRIMRADEGVLAEEHVRDLIAKLREASEAADDAEVRVTLRAFPEIGYKPKDTAKPKNDAPSKAEGLEVIAAE